MAKITERIENYADLSMEDKLKALEALELEDNTAEVERLRNAISKANSENADLKRKHNALLSEDERTKQEQAEKLADMEKELAALRKEKSISEFTAKYVSLGYDEKMARETATALADGDTEKVFANAAKAQEAFAKKLNADLLKGTPRPTPGEGKPGTAMTLKQLKSLSDAEYAKFAAEHPEEYKALYEKGDNA